MVMDEALINTRLQQIAVRVRDIMWLTQDTAATKAIVETAIVAGIEKYNGEKERGYDPRWSFYGTLSQ